MANNDFDWQDTGSSPTNSDWDQPSSKSSPKRTGGHWHAAQTVTALLVVTVLSFLMAYLTRSIQERPIWMMGLIFMVPAAAMLFSALFVENATSAMTPSFSRKAQTIVALVVTLLTFVVGCLSDLVYLEGFIKRDNVVFLVDKSASLTNNQPGSPSVVVKNDNLIFVLDRSDLTVKSAPVRERYNLIFVLDKSGSISGSADVENISALTGIFNQLEDSDTVGLVLFDDEIMGTVPLAPLSSSQRIQLANALEILPDGQTYFYAPLSAALQMIETQPAYQNLPTKIIILTDGDEFNDSKDLSLIYDHMNLFSNSVSDTSNMDDIITRCKNINASVSCIYIAQLKGTSVQQTINATGGMSVDVRNANQLIAGLESIALVKQDDHSDADLVKTASDALKQLSAEDHVGLVVFGSGVQNTVPVAPLTDAQRAQLLSGTEAALVTEDSSYYPALDAALQMLETNGNMNSRHTRIVMLSDSATEDDDARSLAGKVDDLIARCKAVNASVYCVKTKDAAADASLLRLMQETNGSEWTADAQNVISGFALIDQTENQTLNNDASIRLMSDLLPKLNPDNLVGLVTFNEQVLDAVLPAPQTDEQRTLLTGALNRPIGGATYFSPALDKALEIVENSPSARKHATRIILLTDGVESLTTDANAALSSHVDDYLARCKKQNITVSLVLTANGSADESLTALANGSGGTITTADGIPELVDGLCILNLKDLDLLRSDDPSARTITFILLLLEGLTLGFGLSLMLSVSGQFRFQLILSPLMGIAAFFLLKMTSGMIQPHWIAEGLAFSLLGIVFMRRNHESGSYRPSTPVSNSNDNSPTDLFSDF